MEKFSTCNALRRLARQAKNRLGQGKYFEQKGGYRVYNGGYLAEYKLVLLSNKEDEKFYAQVSEMLSENLDVINPIGRLTDKSKMSAMSDMQKERYIMLIKDKYLQMKDRFERERVETQVG